MKKLMFAAALILGVTAANAQLWTQGPDGSGQGLISTNMTDDPASTTFCYDDFVVPALEIWTITRALGNGDGPTGSATGASRTVTFQSAPGSGAGVLQTRTGGSFSSGVMTMPFGAGTEVILGAGHYYIGFYMTGTFASNGQWNWLTANVNPNAPDTAWAHNTGGGFGFGSNPIHIGDILGTPVDLAFTLEGTREVVPEPATFLAIGVGLAVLAARRRK